jgi:hypothetical protein
VDSETHEAGALVRHQLYESLTSVLDLHGSRIRSDSPDTTFLATRYGAGVDESYTKRLPAKGRLSLGYGVRLDRERRETTGAILPFVDEPHTRTDGIPAFLNPPGVDRVGSVTDPAGIPYSETQDYVLLPLGALTEIRRVSGGRISNGGSVLVDYTAAAPPSDAFSTLFQSARVRLDLSDEEAGVVSALVEDLVIPNSFYNAERTEQRRQLAREQVEPVTTTIERNETILRAGDIVSGLDLEALAAMVERGMAMARAV